jgi:hypothetical protein
VAQLVARLVRIEKVRGSSPLSSTHTKTVTHPSGGFFVVRQRRDECDREVNSECICIDRTRWSVRDSIPEDATR